MEQSQRAPFITAHTIRELEQRTNNNKERQRKEILQQPDVPGLLLDCSQTHSKNITLRDSIAKSVDFDEIPNLSKQDMGLLIDWHGTAPAGLSLNM